MTDTSYHGSSVGGEASRRMQDPRDDDERGTNVEYRLPSITSGMNAVHDGNGNWFVSHTLQLGAMSFTYGIPLDQAVTYADNFAAHVRSLVKQAKRERMGIMLPDDGVTTRSVSGLVVPPGANGQRR